MKWKTVVAAAKAWFLHDFLILSYFVFFVVYIYFVSWSTIIRHFYIVCMLCKLLLNHFVFVRKSQFSFTNKQKLPDTCLDLKDFLVRSYFFLTFLHSFNVFIVYLILIRKHNIHIKWERGWKKRMLRNMSALV